MNSCRYYHQPGSDFIVEVSVGLIHYMGANRSVEFNAFVFKNIFATLGDKNSIVVDADVFFVTDAVEWPLLRPGLTLEDEAVAALKHVGRPMAAQRAALMAAFNAYQADDPRRDDVTVVGLRVRTVNAELASADEA